MPQCEAVAATPGRDNTGNRCKRRAVKGAAHCVMHGGKEETRTPERVRTRLDRPAQGCTALRRDGAPCNAYALRGSRVCRKHGGTLPTVRKAAADRMLALLAPAVSELQAIIEKPDTSDADRLRAIAMVLDRTGMGPKSEVTMEVKKYESVMDGIMRVRPAEGGVYSVTDAPALELPPATTEDDLSGEQAEDDWAPALAVLNDYRAGRSTMNPPRHLR